MAKMTDLEKEINAALKEYVDMTDELLSKTLLEAGRMALKEVKINSPKRTGEYAKGWRIKELSDKAHKVRVRVYNKTNYEIAHLLEFGHAKVIGGRTYSEPVPAHPHIEPAEEHAIEFAERELKAKL